METEPTRLPGTFLLERFRRRSSDLTPGQRRIAQYIIDNPVTAAFLTAIQLGDRVGVSESSVVRFAVSLGYSGYPELQEYLRDDVKARLTTVDRIAGAETILSVENAGVPEEVLGADLHNVMQTLRGLDRDSFERAVKLLVEARGKYIIAFRGPSAIARFLGLDLQWLLGGVRIVDNSSLMFEQLADIGPRDVAVGISFPRYTVSTLQGFAYAKRRGASTIALTDTVLSPLATNADVVLTASTSLPSFVDSLVAPLSLVNAILTAITVYDKERATVALRHLEEVWESHSVLL